MDVVSVLLCPALGVRLQHGEVVVMSRPEQERGLETRYYVRRMDDVSGKHDDCRYFILDPQHDAIAEKALRFYAEHARQAGYGALAADLDEWFGTPGQETCTCFWTDPKTWLSAASCGYGSGYEPGSQREWNPDCPEHGEPTTPHFRDGGAS